MKTCPKCQKHYDDSWSICLDDQTPLTQSSSAPSPGTKEFASRENQPFWSRFFKKGDIELTIGQYLLNRIGVLSFVAGFAFFIAYSFQFIGVWGKLGLGFIASAALLLLGKFLEKKPGMQWYGFGLIGGGWSLAYFTTYAMHHIPAVRVVSNPEFALLSLVFVTSLLMVDLFKYRSQAITTIVYLLGFFTAGIGSVTTYSLVYAALLTFSLILVIYRMKWNRLMLFAVAASYVTHAFWLGPEILLSSVSAFKGTLEMSRFLLSVGFLSLYGLLYGLAPLLVSEEGEEDRRIQTTTTILNAFFYAIFLFQEITKINNDWRYYAAIALGTFFVGVSCLCKYGVKRQHLFVANMSLAITFFTISFPLKYVDRWVDIAWLCEIPVLIFLGLYFNRFIYRAFAWGLGFVMALKLLVLYDPSHASAKVQVLGNYLTERALIVWIGVLAFSLVQCIYLYFKERIVLKEVEIGIGRVFFGTALFFLLGLSTADLHANLISIAWALMAFIFFAAGFVFKDRWFRYSALTLVALVVGRVLLYDIRDLPTIYRMVLLMGLGVSLLIASFIYGKIAIAKDREAAR